MLFDTTNSIHLYSPSRSRLNINLNDFLLFLKQKKGNKNVHQIFIEPKGAHLLDKDKWKEEFLEELRDEKKTISLITDKYRITGVPFYNNKNENDFIVSLEKVLQE